MREVESEEELEAAADRLLKAAGRDRNWPAYTERALLQKERRAYGRFFAHRDQGGPTCCVLGNLLSHLHRSEIEHMFTSSQLTPREKQVCRAVAQGETYAEIARQWGGSPQAAHHVMSRARAKIAARWKVMPYRGLWKIYAEEVQRPLYIRRA